MRASSAGLVLNFARGACGARTFTVLRRVCTAVHFYHFTPKPAHFYRTLTLWPRRPPAQPQPGLDPPSRPRARVSCDGTGLGRPRAPGAPSEV